MKSRIDFNSEKDWLEYLRAYYAGLAMQGFVAANYALFSDQLALQAVRQASALIAELSKDAETGGEK
jgi:hypothetical protein